MGSPSPPPVPDPIATSSAQGAADVGTSVANTAQANANVYTPLGSSTFAQTGSQSITEPDGTVQSVPTYTNTQTYSPQEQKLFNQQTALGSQLNTTAKGALTNVQGALEQPVPQTSPLQTDVGPAGNIATGYDAGGPIQTSIANNGNQIQTSVNDQVGGIQRSVGPTDFTAATQAAQQAAYARMQPALQQQQQQLTAQLASQGIAPGTAAYNQAMALFGQQQNDAINSSIQTGDAEQQALYGEALNSGNFANTADAQAYSQGLGAGNFTNTALGQQFAQGATAGAFTNSAQAQQDAENAAAAAFQNSSQQQRYGENLNSAQFGNQANLQQFQENVAAQNQPINEVTALMSGGQVTTPQFAAYQSSPSEPAPVSADTYQSAALANQQYQIQAQQSAADLGGLFGLGGTALKGLFSFSDPDLKDDHGVVGKIGDLPVHEFSYRGDMTPLRGFMADEVQEKVPSAVRRMKNGFRAVDYARALASA